MLAKNEMFTGMNLKGHDKIGKCKTCMLSKVHVSPFPQQSTSVSKEVLELVHTDICGPMKVKLIGGSRFFLTFIDDKSRRTFIYFLKRKSEVLEKF